MATREALRGKLASQSALWGEPQARAAFGRAGGSRALGALRRSSETSPQSWVATWIKKEISESPVVLFSEASSPESKAARAALREARVRFQDVDVSGLGDDSSWGSMVSEQLLSASGARSLPVLFVGGRCVGGLAAMGQLDAADRLEELCVDAGAGRLKVEEPFTNSSWTPRAGLRLQPPKDIGGRRWFQDEPGRAKFPEEYKDEARLEYNTDRVSPGAGMENFGRFSAAGLALLRQETNLDDPDLHAPPNEQLYRPFDNVMLTFKPDLGWGYYLRSRDVKRAKSIGPEDAEREGLPISQLKWLYSQGKKKLVDELRMRQCQHKVLSTADVQGLREALKEEMQKERAYSPTRNGVVPGVVQKLSSADLREERYADTKVPLLVAITNWNPASFHINEELQTAAKRLLRATRIVRVEGHRFAEVARNFSVVRFPTLIWLQGGSGEELVRTVGVVSSEAIYEHSQAVLHCRELPPARRSQALAALDRPQRPISRSRWRHDGRALREAALHKPWASIREIRRQGV